MLQGGVFTIAAHAPGAAKRPARPAAGAAPGAIESIAEGVVHGWAAHPSNGGTPAVVDVYDDERYLGSVTADRPRPKPATRASPRRQGLSLPPAARARRRMLGRLRARIAGTQLDLLRLKQPARGRRTPQPPRRPPCARPAPPARALAPAEGRVACSSTARGRRRGPPHPRGAGPTRPGRTWPLGGCRARLASHRRRASTYSAPTTRHG